METPDAIQSTHRTPTCRPRSANGNRHRARCQHFIPFRRFCRYVHDLFTSPTSNIYRPHDGRFAQYENQTRSPLYPSRQRRSPFGWRLESAILDTSPSISLFPFCDSFTNSSPPAEIPAESVRIPLHPHHLPLPLRPIPHPRHRPRSNVDRIRHPRCHFEHTLPLGSDRVGR